MKKNILITGGTTGIGAAIVKLLSGLKQYKVYVLTSRTDAEELKKANPEVKYICNIDLSDSTVYLPKISEIIDDFKKGQITIDCFIHSAVNDGATFDPQRTCEINATSAYNLIIKLNENSIFAKENARVLFFDSDFIKEEKRAKAEGIYEPYAKSKELLVQYFTRCQTQFKNISFMLLNPGRTNTPLFETMNRNILIKLKVQDIEARITEEQAKVSKPKDIAELITSFLQIESGQYFSRRYFEFYKSQRLHVLDKPRQDKLFYQSLNTCEHSYRAGLLNKP